MVDGERLRFDFSHGAPLTAAEIDAIEAEVNAVVRQNIAAKTEEMAPQDAIAAGAMALFGEKYGDLVRVLTLGQALALVTANPARFFGPLVPGAERLGSLAPGQAARFSVVPQAVLDAFPDTP